MSETRQQLAEHLRFYGELGVTGVSSDSRWSKRPDAASEEHRISDIGDRLSDDVVGREQGPHDAASVLALIKTDIGPACTRCKLHAQGRSQVVFGVGDPNADLMFVGEAPGADE